MGQACSCCEDRNKSGNKGMMAKPGGANARKTASGETKLYEPSLKSELTYGGTDTVAAGLVSLSDDRRPALDLYYEQDDAARGSQQGSMYRPSGMVDDDATALQSFVRQ